MIFVETAFQSRVKCILKISLLQEKEFNISIRTKNLDQCSSMWAFSNHFSISNTHELQHNF